MIPWMEKLPLEEILAVAAVLGSYIIALFVVRAGLSALQRRAFMAQNLLLKKTLHGLKTPLNIIFAIAVFRFSQPWLPNGQSISRWTEQGEIALLVLAAGVLLFRGVDYGAFCRIALLTTVPHCPYWRRYAVSSRF